MNGGDGMAEATALAKAHAEAGPGQPALSKLFQVLRMTFAPSSSESNAFTSLVDEAQMEYVRLRHATTPREEYERCLYGAPSMALRGRERLHYYAEKLNGSDHEPDVEDRIACAREQANLVGSLCEDGKHRPVIDIDHGAQLVPSSSPGHHHLYLDTGMEWPEYLALLRALRDAGVLSGFFVKAAEIRGQTFVRVPWVRKLPKDVVEQPEVEELL